jgi:hypothetical protein
MPSTTPTFADPRYGMALDPGELAALAAASVRAQPLVKAIRQDPGQLVLTGEESGGCAKEVGHYVGYLPVAGHPLISIRKLTLLSTNALHRRVTGIELVRFEVFRYLENHLHLWITLHRANQQQNDGSRSAQFRSTLFLGRYGEVDRDNHAIFPAEDGGPDKTVPEYFQEGFRKALAGSRCRECKCKSHFDLLSPIIMPAGLLAAFHLDRTALAKPAAKGTSVETRV